MPPVRLKYWCKNCDHVAKSGSSPRCPTCRETMTCMGRIWKPGPKGNRMKNYPEGWGNFPETDNWLARFRQPGRKQKVRGKIVSWRWPY